MTYFNSMNVDAYLQELKRCDKYKEFVSRRNSRMDNMSTIVFGVIAEDWWKSLEKAPWVTHIKYRKVEWDDYRYNCSIVAHGKCIDVVRIMSRGTSKIYIDTIQIEESEEGKMLSANFGDYMKGLNPEDLLSEIERK